MLVTNLSAGELSKNLFGRIDIPQYYSGAAKVENFDIIPTGGIRKRVGIEFLNELGLSGRLIPFSINRNKGYILYFSTNGIQIYKTENGNVQPEGNLIAKAGERNLNYTADEIREIQYAQNFNTMILVHENHPPLEIKYNSETLIINWLEVSFRVTVEASKNTTDEEEYKITDEEKSNYEIEEDEQYKTNGWLTTDGNYPSAVSFYNGRLFFAGVKTSPQRIFVSAIKEEDKPFNFATYKMYLEPEIKYTVLFGQIDKDDTSLIKTEDFHVINFTEPAENYYIKSRIYPANTKIEYINMKRVKLTNEANVLVVDIEGIKEYLKDKINQYDEINRNPTVIQVYNREWSVYYWDGYYDVTYHIKQNTVIKCHVKARSIDVVKTGSKYDRYGGSIGKYEWQSISPVTRTITLPDNAAKLLETNPNYFDNEIKNVINGMITSDLNSYKPPSYKPSQDGQYDNHSINEQNKNIAISKVYENIQELMVYELTTEYSTELIYDSPLNILTKVLSWIENTDRTYIPFFTKKILLNKYPTPDCGFFFEIASDMNDAVRWLANNRGLIVGTETGEHLIPTDVHATNIRAVPISSYGSDKIQGTRVGNATCFFKTGKKELVEYYPNEYDNFRANNMALLSPQMLSESPAVEFDYVSAPYTKLLITREDGTIATLLYERSTGTFAWGRITTNGEIKSMAVLPGEDGNDDIYMIVQREIKKGDACEIKYFLERLQEKNNVYLDSYQQILAKEQYQILKEYYGDGAKLCHSYLSKAGKEMYDTLDADKEPDFTEPGEWFIGYLYKSTLRTMPVITNDKLKLNRIINIRFRFLNSYMPEITNIANGEEESTNILTPDEPFSGVHRALYPDGSEQDIQVEINSCLAAPVKILSLYAETDGGK